MRISLVLSSDLEKTTASIYSQIVSFKTFLLIDLAVLGRHRFTSRLDDNIVPDIPFTASTFISDSTPFLLPFLSVFLLSSTVSYNYEIVKICKSKYIVVLSKKPQVLQLNAKCIFTLLLIYRL